MLDNEATPFETEQERALDALFQQLRNAEQPEPDQPPLPIRCCKECCCGPEYVCGVRPKAQQ